MGQNESNVMSEKTLFDGATFDEQRDGARLSRQLGIVLDLMSDGAWRSPEAMEAATGFRWASISARLRDLRKDKFGGHVVCRKSAGNGLFEYMVILHQSEQARVPSTNKEHP